MVSLIKQITNQEDDVMQWNMQEGSITTNLKVKIYFTLPEISAKTIVTWNWHVDDSTKVRYDMILGRDILTDFWLNLKFSYQVIEEIMDILQYRRQQWLIWVSMILNI